MLLDRIQKLAAFACAAVIAAPSLSWASSGAGVPQIPGERDRLAQINDRMGLARSSILRLDLAPDETPETLFLIVNDAPLIVKLEEHSVRSPNYRVLAQIEDGSLVDVEPTPVNTLRGRVVGLDDAVVSGSMEKHGLHLRLVLTGAEYWIEPLRGYVDDAAIDEYILYNITDVLDCKGACAMEEALRHQPFLWTPPQGGSGDGGIAGGIKVAELACDADFEYFTKWGSIANVQNRINSIINSNNVLYEAQTGLSHTITAIIVRTSSNQPYTQTNASNLLSQFRNHWNANHANIQRDVAHLFTGKTLGGSTIGIAYVGVVCNIPWAYGLSQSDFSSNFACVTDLTAHELGHNWNAPHCSCPSHTMNASITCANNFHSSSINTMVQFANSLTCLTDAGDPPPDPVGACCIGDTCWEGANWTESLCISRDGTFAGDGSTCAQVTCGGDPPACPTGEIEDCNGNCAPASWVGDGICDDGSYVYNGNAIYFNCDEFDCDGGDCNCNGDPDPPGDPVSLSVSSINVTAVNVGQGRHKGQAVVTIVDNNGQPVQGATVTGTFSSPFNETHSGATNAQGQVTLQTNGVKQGGSINFNFCVTNVTHSTLNYAPGDNNVTCAP